MGEKKCLLPIDGSTYEFKCKLRTSSATPSRAAIYIYQRYGGAWNSTAIQTCVVGNTWELKSIYTTIFSGTVAIIVRVYLYTDAEAGAQLWVDDIKFYIKNEYIENGKCEFTDSPTLDGGTTGLTNATWAQSAAQKHSGATSWRLDKTTAAGAGAAYVYLTDNLTTTDMHGLTAGATYEFDLWYYLNGIVTLTNAVVVFQERYGGVWNNTTIFSGSVLDAWTNVKKTVTLNTATTGVTLLIQIASAEPVTSKIYLDDIQLRREPRLIIDLYAADNPTYAAILSHNLSASAVVKVEANTTASWTTPAVSETMTVAELMLLFLANATAYRYWSFVFRDFDTNEDGYAEIGYAGLGDYFQPTYGAARIFPEKIFDNSVMSEYENGDAVGSEGTKLKEWDINIASMSTAIKNLFDAMMDELHTYTPMVFVLDQSNLALFPAKWGRIIDYGFSHIKKLDMYSATFTFRGK